MIAWVLSTYEKLRIVKVKLNNGLKVAVKGIEKIRIKSHVNGTNGILLLQC